MFERLTGANHKELGFHTYIGAKNPYSVALTLGELLLDNTNPKYRPREILNDVFDRLAAYEDSGLSPEEVQELKVSVKICEDCWNHAQAKAEGRLVVLPCKPETKVYRVWKVDGREPVIDEYYAGLRFMVDNLDNFGKTVFLTREEAEKALEVRE